MEFLYWLEGIRFPILDAIMLFITYLGDEITLLVVALVLFWCVDKRKCYYIMAIGFIGTVANQFLKLLFRIPRPWVRDPSFSAVEGAKEGAGGYSFPSGHSQNSVGIFGGIASTTRKKWIRILSIVICILVPFSRMYLGVHTPADIFVGSAMAIILIFVLKPLIFGYDGKLIPYVLGFMALLSVIYLCFIKFYPFPADIDVHNLESGTKNAFTLVGALSGFCIVYFVDTKWLKFPVKAVWWAQILKVVLGFAIVLALKEGLSTPLASLCGEHIGRMIRYFLMVIVAGIVWPLTFRWFSAIGKKG